MALPTFLCCVSFKGKYLLLLIVDRFRNNPIFGYVNSVVVEKGNTGGFMAGKFPDLSFCSIRPVASGQGGSSLKIDLSRPLT